MKLTLPLPDSAILTPAVLLSFLSTNIKLLFLEEVPTCNNSRGLVVPIPTPVVFSNNTWELLLSTDILILSLSSLPNIFTLPAFPSPISAQVICLLFSNCKSPPSILNISSPSWEPICNLSVLIKLKEPVIVVMSPLALILPITSNF